MPQNIIPSEAEAPTVVAPSSGDPVTDGSIVQGEQPITDWLQWLHNRLTGGAAMPVDKADTTAGAELATQTHALGALGTSSYWLINEWSFSGETEKLREYVTGTSRIVTYNAQWDADTATWAVDAAGRAWRATSGTGTTVQHASSSTTAGGWTDGDWSNDGSAGIGADPVDNAGVLQLFGSKGAATPAANTLYSDNMPKAWGSISVASGSITALSTFNVDEGSLALNGTSELTVPLRQPMADGNYVVSPGAVFSSGEGYRMSGLAAGSFNIGVVDSGGSLVDLTANTRTIQFTIFGRQ